MGIGAVEDGQHDGHRHACIMTQHLPTAPSNGKIEGPAMRLTCASALPVTTESDVTAMHVLTPALAGLSCPGSLAGAPSAVQMIIIRYPSDLNINLTSQTARLDCIICCSRARFTMQPRQAQSDHSHQHAESESKAPRTTFAAR